jgi:uncharacterized membrane protein
MVLMAIDHASVVFNGGRIATDSAYLLDPTSGAPAHVPGTILPAAQFLTRWITHLCAPTFLFLSGTSLALSTASRRAAGDSEASIDRHLFIRALVILALEGLLSLMAWQGVLILQVLYAIGVGLLLMIPLRRLDTRLLIALGAGWLLFGEAITRGLLPVGSPPGLVGSLLLAPVYAAPVTVLYPVVPWWALMALGWTFGRHLLSLPAGEQRWRSLIRELTVAGGIGLLVFAVVRGVNAYGNLGLHRDDSSLVQWLHVSKYPPSIAFVGLELGIAALALAGCVLVESRLRTNPSRRNPLLLFGQTALFFYVLHIPLLGVLALLSTGGIAQAGLVATYLGTAVGLLILYPICAAYRRYKSGHPRGWAQYL